MFRSIGHGVDDLGGHETAGFGGGAAARTYPQSRPCHLTHSVPTQPRLQQLGEWPWAITCTSGACAGA